MDRLANVDPGLTRASPAFGGPRNERVAVVGAGYAGMAAAVELATAGFGVTVFEASRTLGGRARSLEKNGLTLDNGQHILIGAYTELLRLMRQVGSEPDTALRRFPLTLHSPGVIELRAAPLPAPFHLLGGLLTARGLSLMGRIRAARFMGQLTRRKFKLASDTSVAQLLHEFRQPADLRRKLWEPLCIAALNTLPHEASAQIFLNVLRDSFGRDRCASDLLLPQVDLSRLFPQPAAAYVQAHGGRVLTGRPIRAVLQRQTGFELDGDPDRGRYDWVVLAVAPHHVPVMLAGMPEAFFLTDSVRRFEYEPILTCYLHYKRPPHLQAPMTGGRFAHWIFDRGQLGGPPGLIAAVISAGGEHEEMSRDAIAARIHEEIAKISGIDERPDWSQIIVEKRATFRCLPGLRRPTAATEIPRFFLCGDYVASDYPGTLESAVRSGVECARLIAAGTAALVSR